MKFSGNLVKIWQLINHLLPPVVMAPEDVDVPPVEDEVTLKYMTPHGK